MLKIIKYVLKDLLRSKWVYTYFGFYFVLGSCLLILDRDINRVLVTFTNIILILVPLIGTLFGVLYYYNAQGFTHMLLAQPLNRKHIIMGQYLGIALSLSVAMTLGVVLPILMGILVHTTFHTHLLTLIALGILLHFIFVAIAIIIAVGHENRLKGLGYALMTWLFFSMIYDGILLMLILQFSDYPLTYFTLVMTFLNPIDLARIVLLIELDIAAMMGYTGAVFTSFFGTIKGIILAFGVLLIWIIIPVIYLFRQIQKKDF